MSFKSEIKASIGWNWNQGVLDNSRLDCTRQLLEGNGPGQAEAVWHAEGQALPSGTSQTLDLTALEREVLGADLVTTLLLVKGLLVVTDASSSGKLVVGASGGAEWSAPFGADGDTAQLPPDGALLVSNRKCGWPVDDTAKLLKLSAVGGDVTYSIALVGTLTASGSGSSGS